MKSFEQLVGESAQRLPMYCGPAAYEFPWERVHSCHSSNAWYLQSPVGHDGHF